MQFSHPLLRLPKRYRAETIAAEVAALPASAWVPHPGRLPGNDAVLLITPLGQMTNGFTGQMAPTEHLLKCPYIMEIMADLGAVWGRSRLMGLAPGATVPEHVDVGYYWRTHIRIHIPVVTSPKVLFTCGEHTVHMEPGECWVFDSFQQHRVQNGGAEKRIHLVLDTVGGDELWDLIEQAQSAEEGRAPLPAPLQPGQARADALAYERANAPDIMSPWEVRCHLDFILAQSPDLQGGDRIAERLERFARTWAAAWAQFGASPVGLPTYRRLIALVQQDLARSGAAAVRLPNCVPLDRALNELIFSMAAPDPSRKAA